MKKAPVIFGILSLVLIGIVCYSKLSKAHSSSVGKSVSDRRTSSERHDMETGLPDEVPLVTKFPRNTSDQKKNIDALKRELESTKSQLEKISRPLNQDLLSSTVNAEIKSGETLVTGGYRTSNGNYELTMLTPRSVTLDDGQEAIEIESKVLSVDSDFVKANGLDTLATNARNTLQHGESWNQDDVTKILNAGRESGSSKIFSSPEVVSLPSSPFTVSLSDGNGAQYSLEGSVSKSPNGGFVIQSRVERTPRTE